MSEETRAAIQRVDEAFNTHDIDALAGCIADECLFEDITPPDAARNVGQEALLGAFQRFFNESPNAHCDVEELITTGDRVDGHVRGADVMRLRDGRAAESLADVKG